MHREQGVRTRKPENKSVNFQALSNNQVSIELPMSGRISTARDSRRANENSVNKFEKGVCVGISLSIGCALAAIFALGWGGQYIVLASLIVVADFLYIAYLVRWIMDKDDSDIEMRKIADAIQEGSESYLSVQYTAIFRMAILTSFVLMGIYLFRESPDDKISPPVLAILTGVSFLVGCFCSALAGYMGVWVSVRVNLRVAIACSKFNYSDALLLSFRGGAVSASLSAAMCILGITMLFLMVHIIFVNFMGVASSHVPLLLVGYGFGASFVALFMQLGGGIYTKAADVGADMCGKIELNIPEDDPRNPAVIADLVGDNVGDCAGSMADVFESIAAEMIGTMILGSTLAHDAKIPYEPFLFFPLIVHSLDLVVSAIGIQSVYSKSDNEDPLAAMTRSYALCLILAFFGFFGTTRLLLYTDVAPNAWWHFGLCGLVGNVTCYLLLISTQYYTDYNHAPVKRIVAASQTGHGTNVISGISIGMESTGFPIIILSSALLSSYTLGFYSGLPARQAGIFGTAVATMGMLCSAVFVLSMNNFGPIADNAGGIVEMSGQSENVRKITDRLDAVGNVTKAASKGYAVGGSALACFVLFQAYLDEISMFLGKDFNVINIANIEVVIGGLLAIMMVFVFTGWAMEAVGRTAQKVVWEVRRQFQDKPGIMDGTEMPDYGQCVRIVTEAALQMMIKPALLALATPISVGFFFRMFGQYTGRPTLGAEVTAGFLLFGTLTGLLMAIFLDNSGGAWDNAKKLIEAKGKRGSLAHQAAITGDTVGDPFKDTAGPSLHVIITTMSTTILVLAPLFIGYNLPDS